MTSNPEHAQNPLETPKAFLAYLAEHKKLPTLDNAGFARLENAMTNEDILRAYTLIEDTRERNPENAEREAVFERWYPHPKKVFHASQHEDLKVVQPRLRKTRHPDEPPQIFASPSEQIASMFINDIENMTSGSYDSGRTWDVVIGDEKRFRERDAGGYIYELPPSSFSTHPDRRLGVFEWQSTEHVEPLLKKFYPSALDAMLEHGIRVYFLMPEEYKAFENAENQKEILDQKHPYKK